MKTLRFYTIILVCLFLGFFSIGLFVPSIEYSINLDIQAPITKGYNAIASHDMKPLLYTDIIADKTRIQDFKEGYSSFVTYSEEGKEKYFTENLIKVDSLQYLEFTTESAKTLTHSKIYFTDKGLRTRLKINEEIMAASFFERAYLVLLKSTIVKNRKAFYTRRKQIVESTPDYSIKPEELLK